MSSTTAPKAPSGFKRSAKRVLKHQGHLLHEEEPILATCIAHGIETPQLSPVAMQFGALGAAVGHHFAKKAAAARAAEVVGQVGTDATTLTPEDLPKRGLGFALTDRRLLVTDASAKTFIAEVPLDTVDLDTIEHKGPMTTLVFSLPKANRFAVTSMAATPKTAPHFIAAFAVAKADVASRLN